MNFLCLIGFHNWHDELRQDLCGRKCQRCDREQVRHSWKTVDGSRGGTQMVNWYNDICERCGAKYEYDEEDGSVKTDDYTPGPKAPQCGYY